VKQKLVKKKTQEIKNIFKTMLLKKKLLNKMLITKNFLKS